MSNNEEQNSDYYSAPAIKKIKCEESIAPEKEERIAKEPTHVDESVLGTLSVTERKIFNELLCDKPTSVDELVKGGYPIGTVMATLTVLEIKGLISSLPGGLYIRK